MVYLLCLPGHMVYVSLPVRFPSPDVPCGPNSCVCASLWSLQSLYKITEMQKCVEAVVECVQVDRLPPSQQTFELLARGVTGLSFACCSQFIEKALKFCIEW